jgi:hypothetical protein
VFGVKTWSLTLEEGRLRVCECRMLRKYVNIREVLIGGSRN